MAKPAREAPTDAMKVSLGTESDDSGVDWYLRPVYSKSHPGADKPAKSQKRGRSPPRRRRRYDRVDRVDKDDL